MKRCSCLHYKDLQYLKKDSRIWIYDNKHGLIPFENIYPLVEFDCGKAIPICPYYLYIKDDMRISRAYFKQKSISDTDEKLINEAVKSCKNRVELFTHNFIEERHAIILYFYAKKKSILVNEYLFESFYSFLQERQLYLDIRPCLSIPPVEHIDRMNCLNDCWLEAFEEYIKERT